MRRVQCKQATDNGQTLDDCFDFSLFWENNKIYDKSQYITTVVVFACMNDVIEDSLKTQFWRFE